MPRRAVFLDKDGTLIQDVPYNVDPSRIRLLPGAIEGLRRLHAAGYLLIVVTNQSGIARGRFPEHALGAVAQRLRQLLAPAGVPLADFYYCPHHPDGPLLDYAVECACRKPEPGLITRAAEEHDLDLSRSWLIGDILNDVQAGNRAGCRTILLDNGGETEWLLDHERLPHYVASDLREASTIIAAVDAGRDLPTLPLRGRRTCPDTDPAASTGGWCQEDGAGASSKLRLLRRLALGAGAPMEAGSWSSSLKEQVHE